MKAAMDIPEELLQAAEERAAARGRTLDELATEALVALLDRMDGHT